MINQLFMVQCWNFKVVIKKPRFSFSFFLCVGKSVPFMAFLDFITKNMVSQNKNKQKKETKMSYN